MLLTFDSVIATAFFFGIVSALSLPLGTLTSVIWKPSDRSIAFLMSFGGGALLAALTIDLVAGTVADGHFYSLAAGCIAGGIIFIVLNNIVNDFGGFLRKTSTTFYHLRKKEYRQFKQILSMVKRADVFQDLSDDNYKLLSSSIQNRTVKKGDLIFSKGDIAEELYIIGSGSVGLIDPTQLVETKILKKNSDIGWLAFLTGTPYRFTARAQEEVNLWVLPRSTFFNLLTKSPVLAKSVQNWIRKPSVTDYLIRHHDLSSETVTAWQNNAIQALLRHGVFSSAMTIDHNNQAFRAVATKITGFDLIKSLPEDEIEVLSSRLIYKIFSEGETFYYRGEDATNLYIIDRGLVSMLDDTDKSNHANELNESEAFGYMAFLTGGRYTKTAMARKETGVWVLHKKDFNELLTLLPVLRRYFKLFLKHKNLKSYLQQRQNLSQNDATKWIKRALQNLKHHKDIVPANKIGFDLAEHKGAPLGIWLGLFLDSIPEALVIGAGVAQASLGFSLLAGLFFSNYPESLSSSVGMREQGMKFSLVLTMWTILMVSTGLFSALGSMYFAGVSDTAFAFTEGVAAGAMLTMIAQTMLPEAYLKGGEIVGFSTLLGFLAAIFFKTLE